MSGYLDQYRYSYSGTDCRAYAFFPEVWKEAMRVDAANKDTQAQIDLSAARITDLETAKNIAFEVVRAGHTDTAAAQDAYLEAIRNLRAEEDNLDQLMGSLEIVWHPPEILLESIHTISFSLHEPKGIVRALGHRGPKGFARSVRTIAGTLIFTVVEGHPLGDLIASDPNVAQPYFGANSASWSVDAMEHGIGSPLNTQGLHIKPPTALAPFNIYLKYVSEILPYEWHMGPPTGSTIPIEGRTNAHIDTGVQAANERYNARQEKYASGRHMQEDIKTGYMHDPGITAAELGQIKQASFSARGNPKTASLMLVGVEIIDEGIVTSVNDMVTEITMNFIARDFYEFSQFAEQMNLEGSQLPDSVQAEIQQAVDQANASYTNEAQQEVDRMNADLEAQNTAEIRAMKREALARGEVNVFVDGPDDLNTGQRDPFVINRTGLSATSGLTD